MAMLPCTSPQNICFWKGYRHWNVALSPGRPGSYA